MLPNRISARFSSIRGDQPNRGPVEEPLLGLITQIGEVAANLRKFWSIEFLTNIYLKISFLDLLDFFKNIFFLYLFHSKIFFILFSDLIKH